MPLNKENKPNLYVYMSLYIEPFRCIHRASWVECSPMALETWVQSQVSRAKDSKMVLDAALLNIQRYKVRIKGKVEQSRERSSTLPLHLGAVAIEKGAFGSPSTIVANFTYMNENIFAIK